MRQNSRLSPYGIWILVYLLAGPVLFSQGPSDEAIGTHIVRRGETLEGIAAYYLGSSQRWREIWSLNEAEIPDPNRLQPGFELKLKISGRFPDQAARIANKSRKVEEQRAPRDFSVAHVNDLLKPLDKVRTKEASSAEIAFGDGTRLMLTENTRVILGEEPKETERVGRRQIQIEFGQADLARRASPGSGIEIEIVMGDTVVKPRPAAVGEELQARTRRPQGQGAQLMVYAGKSDIEAAGQNVEVAQGMGTTVEEGKPPAPPEKLLAAPGIARPRDGARFEFPNPTFEWQRVAGAESYTLEICRDRDCVQLETKINDLRDATWQPPAPDYLPVADLYWRITARSPSGLDGYPSASAGFAVLSAELDRVPPQASLRFSGPMVGVGNRLVLGIGAEIEIEDVSDQGTGLLEWTRLLDDKPVSEDDWTSATWSSGQHAASILATDKAGNRTQIEPQPFIYDPDPPIIQWGVEDGPEIGRASGPSNSEIDPLLENENLGLWARTTGNDRSPLIWTSSSIKWLPMEFGDWKIHSDKPFILIRARKKKKSVSFSPVGESVTKSRGLWIHATDAGCGVESLRYQLLIGPAEQKVLVIEAMDALDNKTRVVWSLGVN